MHARQANGDSILHPSLYPFSIIAPLKEISFLPCIVQKRRPSGKGESLTVSGKQFHQSVIRQLGGGELTLALVGDTFKKEPINWCLIVDNIHHIYQ
jgi:hypothetical protein